MKIDWKAEVEKRREEIIAKTQQFLQIKSVLDETTTGPGAPFGQGIKEALDFLLHTCEKEGFQTKNIDGYAAHAEYGSGEKLLGILCHIDVVPEGDGWTSSPFSAEIREGKIYARGALDDKGPTMAAFYALKIVKELGLPLQKRVRMIIGTDEESGWKCVETYFKHEEMPTIGFAPDADFPIIFAEKGICNFELALQTNTKADEYPMLILQSLRAGRRLNMVPDSAEAVVEMKAGTESMEQDFMTYCEGRGRKGSFERNGNSVTINIDGVSAHGAEPHKGVNAGIELAGFLATQNVDARAKSYIEGILHYFHDTKGNALGIAYEDGLSGPLTINAGKISYDHHGAGKVSVNMRYPVTADFEQIHSKLQQNTMQKGFGVEVLSNQKPHHVDKNHMLVKTLQRVYEEQTGTEAELIAIGGGTYARSLEAGVAFGPLFPGRLDTAHQKDEHISIEDLLLSTAIYAQAIYELAKEAD